MGMNDFLTDILHMSLTGSIVIIIVLIARMLMKKLPKKYMYLLWGIVGFRLLCPIAFESSISIFNIRPIRNSVENVKNLPLIRYGSSGQAVAEAGHTGTARSVSAAAQSIEKINMMPFVLTLLWAAIAVGIVCLIVWKYVAIKQDLKHTREVKPGMFVGHQIDTPFVMGIIKPKIYMPSGLTESEMEYLTLHEETHIRRGDTLFKAIGLLALVLHWFNPLVWIAYVMFVRDMEMSCDEAVIAKLGNDVKADYSMSLVSFARRSDRSKYIVVPIAFSKMLFGRKDVKMRIKNVLGYHAASKLISTMALVLVASIALVCLFNATSRADDSDEVDDTVVTEASDVTGDDKSGSSDAVTLIDDNGEEIVVDNDQDAVISESADEATDDSGSKSKVRQQLEEIGEYDTTPMPEEGPAPDEVSKDADLAVPEPEETDEPVKAVNGSIKTTKDNIFNKELPVFDGVAVDVTLNLPKGTKVEDNPDLARFMIPGTALEGDTFSIYYKESVSEDTFMKMMDTLINDYGFVGVEPNGGTARCFCGRTHDGLSVTLEQFGNYLRISYYETDANGENTFARVG